MLRKSENRVWSALGIVSVVLAAMLVLSAWSWQAPNDGTAGPELTNPKPVQVTVTKDSLALSSATLPAGEAAFEVTNEGSTAHSFAISGPVEQSLDSKVAAGKSQTLEANLEPGTYTAYCPIKGHAKSESVEFTVGR